MANVCHVSPRPYHGNVMTARSPIVAAMGPIVEAIGHVTAAIGLIMARPLTRATSLLPPLPPRPQ